MKIVSFIAQPEQMTLPVLSQTKVLAGSQEGITVLMHSISASLNGVKKREDPESKRCNLTPVTPWYSTHIKALHELRHVHLWIMRVKG